MSASASTDDLWHEMIRLSREYARRRYGGRRAIGLTIHLRDASHYEPFPDETPAPAAASRVQAWNTGPAPRHLSDFRQVYWPGLGTFTLSETQAQVVRILWTAWQAGEAELVQATVLERSGSGATRLADLFRGHPAWGTLIRWRGQTGLYRLPVLPEDVGPSEDAA